MGRTSLRPWFMGNKMQFEAVACRLFLHYSYTLAQKASNYGIFCFYNIERNPSPPAILRPEVIFHAQKEQRLSLRRHTGRPSVPGRAGELLRSGEYVRHVQHPAHQRHGAPVPADRAGTAPRLAGHAPGQAGDRGPSVSTQAASEKADAACVLTEKRNFYAGEILDTLSI